MSKQQMPQNRAFFTAFYRKMQFWADATALPFWAPLALMQRPLWTPNRTSLGQWPSNLLLVYHQMQKSPQNHPIKETILEKGIWYNFQPKTIFGNQGSLQQPLCGLELSFLFFWPLYISLVYYTIWIWSQKTSNHEYRSLWTRPDTWHKVLRNTFFRRWREGVTDLRTDGQTDGRTNGPTDGRTDRPSFRGAWTRLKTYAHSILRR